MARGASSAAQITAANLRVDAATAEILHRFEAAGVASVLLKGVSLSRWISTRENPRLYLDCDLLIRPGDLSAAERALDDLGFKRLFDERRMPEWWREHAATWTRDEDGVKVDLHRDLVGSGIGPERLWRVLSAQTETLDVAGYSATALTIPARALHVALHAAQHGVEWDRPQTDLQRALAIADEEIWREAAQLAAALDATSSFAAGLRLLPEGRALADRLGLPADVPTDVALRAGTPPPVALGLDQLARARGVRARFAILWRKLVPPPTFMRHWSPRARQGRLGLLLAYLWRPVWLLSRLPAGIRAWREARRLSGDSGAARRP
jgi:Uncharacterised nucleotidyltransferase